VVGSGEPSNTDPDRVEEKIDDVIAPYVMFLLAGFVFVITLVEGLTPGDLDVPARSALVETVGTVERYEEVDGDVHIKLREHPTEFIYPMIATGWHKLMENLRDGARVRLLHEHPRRPNRIYRNALAVFEVEVDGVVVIRYKTTWGVFRRLEYVLVWLACGIAAVWMVQSVRKMLARERRRA
jgi:hypothetical protein